MSTLLSASIIPVLIYRDAPGAIEWLCSAFGFEKHLVVPSEDGTAIAHAELTCGGSMIMLGSAEADNDFGRRMAVPEDFGGKNTQSVYMIVEDCDVHYARAKAAGAEIIIDIKDESYGGRGYTCKDVGGHLWSFGTYNPRSQ